MKKSAYSDFVVVAILGSGRGGLLKIALDFGEITEFAGPDIPGTFHAVPGGLPWCMV